MLWAQGFIIFLWSDVLENVSRADKMPDIVLTLNWNGEKLPKVFERVHPDVNDQENMTTGVWQ